LISIVISYSSLYFINLEFSCNILAEALPSRNKEVVSSTTAIVTTGLVGLIAQARIYAGERRCTVCLDIINKNVKKNEIDTNRQINKHEKLSKLLKKRV
jgi:hypothetical protein